MVAGSPSCGNVLKAAKAANFTLIPSEAAVSDKKMRIKSMNHAITMGIFGI